MNYLLIFLALTSCTLTPVLQTNNSDKSIVIKSDTYADLIKKYGEPVDSYVGRSELGTEITLKYENILNYDVIYIRLDFQFKDYYIKYSQRLAFIEWDNRQQANNRTRDYYHAVLVAPPIMQPYQRKSKLMRSINSEKLLEKFPELWVVKSYDIRPEKN